MAFAGARAIVSGTCTSRTTRAQFTDEGDRLVRCAIGDGGRAVRAIVDVLEPHNPALTASIEPGAIEARHIRLSRPSGGLATRRAPLGSSAWPSDACAHRLGSGADYRTPWERSAPGPEIVAFEMAQVDRSVENVRAMGWL